MRILYIDTTSSYLYSAIADNDNIIDEVKEKLEHDLSEKALPKIVEMFENKKIDPKSIEKIIVVNGPGSFTGTRIGVTIAKVYAWSLNIPITTISALEAMTLSANAACYHVPVINARREKVFAAIYDEQNNEILKPQHIDIKKLEEKLTEIPSYVIITNDDVNIIGTKEKYNPDIKRIIGAYKDKESINAHAVNPEYLKLTEAEENKNDSRI